jgi:hypothetical protein
MKHGRQAVPEKKLIDGWCGVRHRNVYTAGEEWACKRDAKIMEQQMFKKNQARVLPLFKPILNAKYNKDCELKAFDERLEFAERERRENKKKIAKEMDSKFKPKLNEKSLRMAKNRTPLWATSTASK